MLNFVIGITVLAIGGNSLVRSKKRSSFEDQLATVGQTCGYIADLIEAGNSVVITHGNGPQVGFLLIRSHLSRNRLPEVPLDACNAQTQAEIGYMIQQSLGNEFGRRGVKKGVVTVVTQVVVDKHDKAFEYPSKPVGPFYTKKEAANLEKELGWTMREDAGRGFRRLVPSPKPVEIVERKQIEQLLGAGFVVIACGGGGIPVVKQDGFLHGVAAVIDKDLASSLLAKGVGAERLVMSTAVEQVYLDFGKPEQRPISQATAEEMHDYLEAGQFAPGSMGPKIEAALEFLENGGKEVLITDPEHITEALEGKTGTRIGP
ncbi:carbamate kinase [candidate division WOR-3 bacterium JGI_Cruoil_03_51_56]|uniref:Carbamate kinase n=1 Tax=candidate division WOR-3 bacterium JGI_Cruoil_03_51_56 TaxID=1973747 RepID=A0A235BWD1_UNCW3|nr:MAG: carbamate kinase [candidate division WOR-3 bacterium JGI_Cruoil_03_51_56]